MQICDKREKGYVEVWLSNKDQRTLNTSMLTQKIKKQINDQKCKIVFYMSGCQDLLSNTENLLINNMCL